MLSLTGMAGWTRDLGRIRALGVGPLLGALVFLGACSGSSAGTGGPPVFAGETGPSVGVAGSANAGGASGGELSCNPPTVAQPVFLNQIFNSVSPARAELYSWTTDEQAAELRADKQLLAHPQQPEFVSNSLRSLTFSADPAAAQLATVLSGPQFATGRVAWAEPWAMRTTPDGQDPGGNLLRIVLKPEAWVAVLKFNFLQVVDLQNQPVLLTDAVATPARIAAIFYVVDVSDGGPDCNQVPMGTLGYREFVLGNVGMVQEWSLGTQAIQDRLSANIDQLTQFLDRTRSCPHEVSAQFWNQDVFCNWDMQPVLGMTEEFAYEQALAIPNEQYSTSPSELGALTATLSGDLFALDPLVVTPGSP